MRLDKWLKTTRLIKRRTVAQTVCDQGRVFVNNRPAKAALLLKVGDKVHIEFGIRAITVEVAALPERAVAAQEASSLYRLIEEIRRAPEPLTWEVDDRWP